MGVNEINESDSGSGDAQDLPLNMLDRGCRPATTPSPRRTSTPAPARGQRVLSICVSSIETTANSSRGTLDAQADEAPGGGGDRCAVSSDQPFGIVMQDLDGGERVR